MFLFRKSSIVKMKVLILLLGFSQFSYSDNNKSVEIFDAWVRASPVKLRSSALYLTVKNLSNQDLTIEHIETSVAKKHMMHETIEENGLAKMRHRMSVTVSLGQSVVFKPSGLHVMLMDIDTVFEKGHEFLAHIHFSDGTSIPFNVTVR